MTINYKYEEKKILAEVSNYVDSTYKAHYVGDDDFQSIDLIAAGGMLMSFAASSIIKYAFRFGKKEGLNRKDLLKVIHYAMFMLWELDKESAKEESPMKFYSRVKDSVDVKGFPGIGRAPLK